MFGAQQKKKKTAVDAIIRFASNVRWVTARISS